MIRSDVAGAYLRRLHAPRAPLDVAAGAPPDSRVLLLARERGPEGGKEE